MKKHAPLLHWSEGTPYVAHSAMSTAYAGYRIDSKWFEKLEDFDIWLVCEGQAELEDAEGKIAFLTRGSVLCLRPGERFEFRVSPNTSFSNAYVHFSFYDTEGKLIPCEQIKVPATTGYVHDIPWFEATMRRIMFLQYQQREATAKMRTQIRALTSHLMTALLRDYELSRCFTESSRETGLQHHHAQTISAALSWIYLHPDSSLSAAQLAKKFGYSQRHFGRIFLQASGKTPGQVLIEAKIDHAKKLLSGSALNISEIAMNLNYEDVFYFSRQFKQQVGLSPAKFRASLLSKQENEH